MGRIRIALTFAVLALAGGSVSAGSQVIYWELDGSQQGPIQGEVTAQEYAGQIEVLDFHHLLTRDYISGVKAHEEVVVTVRLDKSAVGLMRALDTQELMTTCTLHFIPEGMPGGTDYYTIALGNARISAVEPIAPNNLQGETLDRARVRIAYASMSLVHVPSGNGALLIQGK